MLYWIWFIALVAAGWLFAIRTWKESGLDSNNDQFISHSAMTMAAVITWDVLGKPFHAWLVLNMPQKGSDIHELTVLFLSALIALIWVAHPVFIGLMLMDDDGEFSWGNLPLLRKRATK